MTGLGWLVLTWQEFVRIQGDDYALNIRHYFLRGWGIYFCRQREINYVGRIQRQVQHGVRDSGQMI
jgi:hypothetical protein